MDLYNYILFIVKIELLCYSFIKTEEVCGTLFAFGETSHGCYIFNILYK